MPKIQLELVHNRLRDMNLTMDSFKHNVGVDRRTLERIFSGKTKKPQPATINQISHYLGIPHQQLFPSDNTTLTASYNYRDYSPFIVGSPIHHPQYFFGRSAIINKLSDLWQSNPLQNAAVVGQSGMGKTSLFNYLRMVADNQYTLDGDKHMSNRQKLEPLTLIYLDLSSPTLQNPNAIYRSLLMHLTNNSYDEISEAVFFDTLANLTLDARYIIILDEIDVALQRTDMLNNTFWEGLRYLSLEKSRFLSFLLGSKQSPFTYATSFGLSSPFFNIFGFTSNLGPLTSEDAFDMFACSPFQFPDDDCRWIMEESKLYPRLLQLFCWELMTALRAGTRNKEWRDQAHNRARYLPEYGD